ncbi:uncharacterized protein VTP21DRAFT_7391 [Calcarisporiella thermophila]|uniref:uncharacterized protein n=1 Tax=Calcarisporiella thermophila TaxID=911321 RepID=UPI00374418D4
MTNQPNASESTAHATSSQPVRTSLNGDENATSIDYKYKERISVLLVQESNYTLASVFLGISIAALTLQTEMTRYVQKEMNFPKPFFILWTAHTGYIFLLPVQYLFNLFISTVRAPKDNRSVLMQCVDEFMRLLGSMIIFKRLQKRRNAKTKGPADEEEEGVGLINESETISIPMEIVPSRKEMIKHFFWVLAVLSFVGIFPSYPWYIAANYTNMTNLTAIFNTNCFFSYVFSVLLLGEPIILRKILSVALCIFGVLIMSFWKPGSAENDVNQNAASSGSNPLLGNFLACVGAASYGLYQVLYKKMASPPEPSVLFANVTTGLMGFFYLLVLWIPFPLLSLTGLEPFEFPPPHTLAAILLISTTAVLFNATFMTVIALSAPMFAAVGIMLSIPVIALVDMMATHTVIGLETLLGGVSILVAFAMLSWRSKSEEKEEENREVEEVRERSLSLSLQIPLAPS